MARYRPGPSRPSVGDADERMRVAPIQHDIVWEDPRATCALLRPRIAGAAGAGARLIVLPEMFATGFPMRTDVIAEPADGPATTFLVEQATRHDAWVTAPSRSTSTVCG